jgi:two-component system KDP operon response regulator KdpE
MTQTSPVIVVIEDDPAIRLFLRTSLAAHGFKLFEASTGRQGIVEAGVHKPDVIILDLGLLIWMAWMSSKPSALGRPCR